MDVASFPRSGVILFGPNSLHALVSSNIINQVEALLASHKIPEAKALADQYKTKLGKKQYTEGEEAQELQYVYQRIGMQCFAETRFEEAGECFLDGDLDPRVVLSFYPDLIGSLLSSEDSVTLYSGIEECLPSETSVEDIIRNYSPYMSPNTRSAPPTTELRTIYLANAQTMLEKLLQGQRHKRHPQHPGKAQTKDKGKVLQVDIITDTVLAKIYALSEKTQALYELLQDRHDVDLAEVEPVLKSAGRNRALCMIYKQGGHNEKLLEAWSLIAQGEWSEEDVTDPLGDMLELLSREKDRVLVQKWGLWITERDPERGLKLLISRDTGKRKDNRGSEASLLQELQELNPAAGLKYLEHLVLQKRSVLPEFHTQLALACIDQVLEYLQDTAVSKLWRAKASSYASSTSEATFVSYFLSTTPNSESKHARLKTIMLLQGSKFYDVQLIRERLSPHSGILRTELAIVEGKLENHKSSLSILVHDIHDTVAAKAYCALGGAILPSRLTQAIGEQCGLQSWTSVFGLQPATLKNAATTTTDDALKYTLTKILLEVFMNEGKPSFEKAAQLLNAQAAHMDVIEALTMIPDDWPLTLPVPFLASSLRRVLHERHEGQIVKAIAAAQNLKVSEDSWAVIREQGYVVEEADSDDEDKKGDMEYVNEKTMEAPTSTSAVDIELSEKASTLGGTYGVESVP